MPMSENAAIIISHSAAITLKKSLSGNNPSRLADKIDRHNFVKTVASYPLAGVMALARANSSWNRFYAQLSAAYPTYNRLVIKLNGEEILNTDIAEATKDAPMDVREKITRPVGRIAFLGHTDVVYFRNVRIKRL